MSLSLEQLEIRRTMVTASDTYILAGEGYEGQCPLTVYADKVAPVYREPTFEQQIGNALEPIIIARLARDRQLTIDVTPHTKRHRILDWLGATTDGRIGHEAVVEAKAVLHWGGLSKWQKDLPADRVVIQTTIQMLVEGVRRAIVPALLGAEFRVYELELDDRDLGPALLEMNEKFWRNHVLQRRPPTPDASEASAAGLRRLYPKVKGEMVAASRAAEGWAAEYFAAREQRKAAEIIEQQAKNNIMAEIGDRRGIEHNGWRATWWERTTKTGSTRQLSIREIDK